MIFTVRHGVIVLASGLPERRQPLAEKVRRESDEVAPSRALWKRELMFFVRAHVNALDFKRNYGLMKRGRDLLRWTFSFSDAPLAETAPMRKQQNGTFLHSLLCRGTSMNGSCVLVEVFFHGLACQAEHATAWWSPQVV